MHHQIRWFPFGIPKTTVWKILWVTEELISVLSRVICDSNGGGATGSWPCLLIRLAQNPAAKPAGFINGSQICLKAQWEECVLQKQEAIYIWRAPSYMRPPVQVSGYFSWLSWFSPWLRTNPHLLALFFRDEGYPGLERPLGLIKPYKRPASSLRRLGIIKTQWSWISANSLCTNSWRFMTHPAHHMPGYHWWTSTWRHEVHDSSKYDEGIQDTAKGNALREDFFAEVFAGAIHYSEFCNIKPWRL